MGSQSQDKDSNSILVSLLKVPADERTPSMIHIIKDHLKSLEYFKNLVLGDDLIKICRNIELEVIHDREILFEKGDPSDSAYIIVQGTMEIMIEGKEKLLFYDKKKSIKKMHKGTLFGEIGLLQPGSTRSATCISNGTTYLGVISNKYWKLIESNNSNATIFSQDILSMQ